MKSVLDLSDSALIVIDAQKEFVDGLSAEMKGYEAVERISEVLEYFREKEIPIIHFRELHRKQMVDFGRELDGDEGIHCIEGTEKADFVDAVRPKENEYFIPKRRYSGFFATDLDLLLRGLNVKTLYITGFLTNVCVHYTCADAHQYNYRIKVIKEAVRGSDWQAHNASLAAINYLQHGSVISIKDLI